MTLNFIHFSDNFILNDTLSITEGCNQIDLKLWLSTCDTKYKQQGCLIVTRRIKGGGKKSRSVGLPLSPKMESLDRLTSLTHFVLSRIRD